MPIQTKILDIQPGKKPPDPFRRTLENAARLAISEAAEELNTLASVVDACASDLSRGDLFRVIERAGRMGRLTGRFMVEVHQAAQKNRE
jgi:hypothetical protein